MSQAPQDGPPTVVALQIADDHPAFAGHFPGMPIVPGVVLLDEALLAIERATGECLVRCTFTAVKFKQALRPGDPLTLRFERVPPRGYHFALESAGNVVAEGRLRAGTADVL